MGVEHAGIFVSGARAVCSMVPTLRVDEHAVAATAALMIHELLHVIESCLTSVVY
jgi:hypothetical protein